MFAVCLPNFQTVLQPYKKGTRLSAFFIWCDVQIHLGVGNAHPQLLIIHY